MQLAHSKLRFSENKAGKLALSALVIMKKKKKPESRNQKSNKRTKRICVFTNLTNEHAQQSQLALNSSSHCV